MKTTTKLALAAPLLAVALAMESQSNISGSNAITCGATNFTSVACGATNFTSVACDATNFANLDCCRTNDVLISCSGTNSTMAFALISSLHSF